MIVADATALLAAATLSAVVGVGGDVRAFA
jgi:hypothetical protein